MEALYEESAVNVKSKRGSVIYTVLNVIFWICLFVGIAFGSFTIFTIPVKTPEVKEEDYQMALSMFIVLLMFTISFLGTALTLYFVKRRLNISYDYVFVSGELRISKVFNINRRKLLYRIDCENILQLGDVDNTSFERLSGDPNVKRIVCTSNAVPAEGKFLMYIHCAESDGRKLYLLECREELLIQILRFVKRGTLESDYVPQEKKSSVNK